MSTTITTHSINDLEFPAVTVCPPWQSNTALNHLLEKVKGVNFTQEKRQELLNIAEEIFIKIPNRKNGEQMEHLLSIDNMRSIADGQFNLPEVKVQTDGNVQIFDMHFTLELPHNIKELIGEDYLVLDVKSGGEWSYMLQERKYELYNREKQLNMSDAENACIIWDSHLASVGFPAEQEEIRKLLECSRQYDQIWMVGIRKKDGWQWRDGRAWTYQKWDYMQPNNESSTDCLSTCLDVQRGPVWPNVECNPALDKLKPDEAVLCRSTPSIKTGNHTFALKPYPWNIPKRFHLWKRLRSNSKEMNKFNPKLWILNNDTADERELVSTELEGTFTTPGFNTTPPSNYYDKRHKFTATIELPANITQIIKDGALVVDLKVLVPDDQTGNGVEIMTTGPKLEYNSNVTFWQNAEDSCVSKGGHLASVPTLFHWLRMQDFISKEAPGNTGL